MKKLAYALLFASSCALQSMEQTQPITIHVIDKDKITPKQISEKILDYIPALKEFKDKPFQCHKDDWEIIAEYLNEHHKFSLAMNYKTNPMKDVSSIGDKRLGSLFKTCMELDYQALMRIVRHEISHRVKKNKNLAPENFEISDPNQWNDILLAKARFVSDSDDDAEFTDAAKFVSSDEENSAELT